MLSPIFFTHPPFYFSSLGTVFKAFSVEFLVKLIRMFDQVICSIYLLQICHRGGAVPLFIIGYKLSSYAAYEVNTPTEDILDTGYFLRREIKSCSSFKSLKTSTNRYMNR